MNKILILGNHAGVGFNLAKAAMLGCSDQDITLLFPKPSVTNINSIEWEEDEISIKYKNYHFYLTSERKGLIKILLQLRNALVALVFVPQFLRSKAIFSLTGTLLDSKVWYYLFVVLRIKPYFACATGSDIREEARNNEKLYRYFKSANKILALNVDMIHLKQTLSLDNIIFFPFAIDTQKYKPDLKRASIKQNRPLVYFMPSNLDWGVEDNKANRKSFKGNNKFIRAFGRLINEGFDARLILLDRGPDRLNAKKLVKKLNIASKVTFLPEMKKKELIARCNTSDVIVDQFSIGSFGAVGLEAMSCAKPLMIYLDQEALELCYGKSNLPPVINVESEDEIYIALKRISLGEMDLSFLGQEVRQWVGKNHSLLQVHHVIDKLITEK